MTASPAHSPSPRAATTLDLLAAQAQACAKLEQCCLTIAARVEADDLDDLSTLLAERDPLIRNLESLHRRFLDVCPSWEGFLATLTQIQRKQAVESADRFNQSLVRVRETDAAIAAQLRRHKASVSESLGEILTVKATQRAYAGSAARGRGTIQNRFMDRQG